MAALSVADTTTVPSPSPSPPPRRPLSEYSDDTAVATAAARSDKPGLHLVVVGHVDAGKSTLMGRLLHGMGEVCAVMHACCVPTSRLSG
jgi:elongation factor 1 alpha-like protein